MESRIHHKPRPIRTQSHVLQSHKFSCHISDHDECHLCRRIMRKLGDNLYGRHPDSHHRCHRRHLHRSRGRLGAWVSCGNRPLVAIIGSVSMYPLLWLMTLVPVIVCRHLPPSPPSFDVPVTSTYVCVFWTLLPPSI